MFRQKYGKAHVPNLHFIKYAEKQLSEKYFRTNIALNSKAPALNQYSGISSYKIFD